MYYKVYSDLASFVGPADKFAGGTSTGGELIAVTLAVLLLLAVQLFVVQWLWNTVLVRVTTVVKPIPSLAYTLGLLVLVAMILPGSA